MTFMAACNEAKLGDSQCQQSSLVIRGGQQWTAVVSSGQQWSVLSAQCSPPPDLSVRDTGHCCGHASHVGILFDLSLTVSPR